ncbi:hypothetical protein C0J50_12100, partial [Silurus asotus]
MFLTVVCGVAAYIPHRYHFVNENKNWSEAQTYCRDKYTDLATISNMDEMKKLNITLKKENAKLAWIGLKSESVGEWKWSLAEQTFYRDGDTYRNWSSEEPNNAKKKEFCVMMSRSDGSFLDENCDTTLHFVCYNEKSINRYAFEKSNKTWREAQTLCREKYTDLVSVRNQSENQEILNISKKEIPSSNYVDLYVWIGLFNDSWKWSDQSKSSFRYWNPDKPRDDLKCAAVRGSEQHYWNNVSCTEKLPFICHQDKLILIKKSLTWKEALRYCRNHHHDLVSVDSEEMQLWVKKVARNASTE